MPLAPLLQCCFPSVYDEDVKLYLITQMYNSSVLLTYIKLNIFSNLSMFKTLIKNEISREKERREEEV